MIIIQCKILLDFHMHWLVTSLYLTRIRAKATLEIWTGQAKMQLLTSLMFYDMMEHLRKSLYIHHVEQV